MIEASLTAGQHKERFDQLFLVLSRSQDLLAGRAEGVDGRIWVAQDHFEQGASDGDWECAARGRHSPRIFVARRTLPPGVSSSPSMVSLRSLSSSWGSRQGEPLVEVVLGDLPGRCGDRPQRAQNPPCDSPTERDGERGP